MPVDLFFDIGRVVILRDILLQASATSKTPVTSLSELDTLFFSYHSLAVKGDGTLRNLVVEALEKLVTSHTLYPAVKWAHDMELKRLAEACSRRGAGILNTSDGVVTVDDIGVQALEAVTKEMNGPIQGLVLLSKVCKTWAN